jgi:UrcA family protein
MLRMRGNRAEPNEHGRGGGVCLPPVTGLQEDRRPKENESNPFHKEALMKISTRFALALSTTALLGLSTAALAAPARDGDNATKVVRFKDLDISTAAGASELYGRIVTAARVVCREFSYTLTVDCRARAVDEAVQGVRSPVLMSIHRSAVERVEEVVSR